MAEDSEGRRLLLGMMGEMADCDMSIGVSGIRRAKGLVGAAKYSAEDRFSAKARVGVGKLE